MKRATAFALLLVLVFLLMGCKPSASPASTGATGSAGATLGPTDMPPTSASPKASALPTLIPELTMQPTATTSAQSQAERDVVAGALKNYVQQKTDAYARMVAQIQTNPTGYLELAAALLPVTINDASLTMIATMMQGNIFSQALANLFGVSDFSCSAWMQGGNYIFQLSYLKEQRSVNIDGSYLPISGCMAMRGVSENNGRLYSRFEFLAVGDGYASQQYTLEADGSSYTGVQCFFQGQDLAFSIISHMDEAQVLALPGIADDPPNSVDYCTDDGVYACLQGESFTYKLENQQAQGA